MKNLSLLETLEVSGGAFLVTDPTVSPACAGYVIGVLDTADTINIFSYRTDAAEMAAITLEFANQGMFSRYEINKALNSVIIV